MPAFSNEENNFKITTLEQSKTPRFLYFMLGSLKHLVCKKIIVNLYLVLRARTVNSVSYYPI